MSVVISVRIPRRLKEECKSLGVNISEVVRRALEEEVRRRRERLLLEAAERAGEVFSRLAPRQVVELIKEDRKR